MNMAELATAVTERIPVVVVLFDNKVLGMVRQWQTLFFKQRYSQTSISRKTDYIKLTEAFGGIGIKPDLKNKEGLADVMKNALEQAKENQCPVLVCCELDKDLMVLPMVPSGEPLAEPILAIREDGSKDRGAPVLKMENQEKVDKKKMYNLEVGAN
jgi:acetolactate synthase-1/2/3 large subunit